MSNRYFIWKEANCQEINSKWVEISGREFYSLLKESPKKRYFEKIDECVEDGADVFEIWYLLHTNDMSFVLRYKLTA